MKLFNSFSKFVSQLFPLRNIEHGDHSTDYLTGFIGYRLSAAGQKYWFALFWSNNDLRIVKSFPLECSVKGNISYWQGRHFTWLVQIVEFNPLVWPYGLLRQAVQPPGRCTLRKLAVAMAEV